jgi:lysophospholipase L1-like esterase
VLKRALLIVLTVATAAGVDLGAGQLWTKMREGRSAEPVAFEQRYRIPHMRYHHDLRPNVSTDSAMWGSIRYAVATNSFGFKDSRVRDVPLADERPRILFIGDSFTEGQGVAFDSTFVGLVGGVLSVRGVDVLNAGVASYSPIIYWKKTEDLLVQRDLQVHAVVVFIDISDVADEASSYRLGANGNVTDAAPERGWWWPRHSLLYRAVRRAISSISPRDPLGCGGAERASLQCRAAWTTSEKVMRAWGNDGLALADSHMAQLAALLRARHIPLTIVVYPWPHQLQMNDRSSVQIQYWQRWAKREGAQFIELFSAFFARVDAIGLQRTLTDYFIAGDVHWNAVGHRLVADEFLARFAGVPNH